jgi:hypothetical protein
VKILVTLPMILRSRGYYVAEPKRWKRQRLLGAPHVLWLESALEETPVFSDETLAEVQLCGPAGWLRVVSEEER